MILDAPETEPQAEPDVAPIDLTAKVRGLTDYVTAIPNDPRWGPLAPEQKRAVLDNASNEAGNQLAALQPHLAPDAYETMRTAIGGAFTDLYGEANAQEYAPKPPTPRGAIGTFATQFGQNILPSIGTAVGAAGGAALLGPETGGVAAIPGAMAGGTLVGSAIRGAQESVFGAPDEAQSAADVAAHPIAAAAGNLAGILPSFMGGPPVTKLAQEAAAATRAGSAVTQAGLAAIERMKPGTIASRLEGLAHTSAAAARAGLSEGVQERFVQGKDVNPLERAAHSVLTMGPLGFLKPAATILQAITGHAAKSAVTYTVADRMFNYVVNGQPIDLSAVAHELPGTWTAFALQSAIMGLLPKAREIVAKSQADAAQARQDAADYQRDGYDKAAAAKLEQAAIIEARLDAEMRRIFAETDAKLAAEDAARAQSAQSAQPIAEPVLGKSEAGQELNDSQKGVIGISAVRSAAQHGTPVESVEIVKWALDALSRSHFDDTRDMAKIAGIKDWQNRGIQPLRDALRIMGAEQIFERQLKIAEPAKPASTAPVAETKPTEGSDQNALPKSSPGTILPSPPQGTGEAGGERQRVEPSKQGTQTAGASVTPEASATPSAGGETGAQGAEPVAESQTQPKEVMQSEKPKEAAGGQEAQNLPNVRNADEKVQLLTQEKKPVTEPPKPQVSESGLTSGSYPENAGSSPAPATPKKTHYFEAYHPFFDDPLIRDIMEHGGVMPNKANRKVAGAEYIPLNFPEGTPVQHNKIFKPGGKTLDGLAAQLRHDDNYPADYDARMLAEDIIKASNSAKNIAGDNRVFLERQKQHDRFFNEARKQRGKEVPIDAMSVNVGDVVRVGDEDMVVKSVDAKNYSFVLEDGQKYGTQPVEGVIYGKFKRQPKEPVKPVEPPPKAEAPKLRSGEKATGELFQGEDQPFNLAGESVVDHERIAKEKEVADQKAAEAKAKAEKEQGNLFQEAKPETAGGGTPEKQGEVKAGAAEPPASKAVHAVDGAAESELTASEKTEAAKALGHEAWTPEAAKTFRETFADWVAGAKNVTGKLAQFFKRVLDRINRGVLSISMIFTAPTAEMRRGRDVELPRAPLEERIPESNRTYEAAPQIETRSPEDRPFTTKVETPRFTVESTSQIPGVENRPAATGRFAIPTFRKTASFGDNAASANVRRMADWIVERNDHQDKPFIVSDKTNGRVYVFDGDGRLIKNAPALYGKEFGDYLRGKSLEGGAKITPAGRFRGEVDEDPEGVLGRTVDLRGTESGEFKVAIHRLYLGDPKEQRPQRLQSDDPRQHRISYGCINVDPKLMDETILPNFENGGTVYVLPESKAGVGTFTGFGDTNAGEGAKFSLAEGEERKARFRTDSELRRKERADFVEGEVEKAGDRGGLTYRSSVPGREDAQLLVTPEPGDSGKWRVTQVDNHGPYGHYVFKNREAAIRAVAGESHTELVPGPTYFALGPYKLERNVPSTRFQLSDESLRESAPERAASHSQVQAAVDKVARGFKGVKTVVVKDGSELPQSAKDELARRGIEDPNRVKGVLADGKVYINAAAHETPEAAARTALHEIGSHLGVDKLLEGVKPGSLKHLDSILQREFPDEYAATKRQYRPSEQVSETLAKIMERTDPMSDTQRTVWNRIMDYVRVALARLGIKGWSRKDVEALLRRGLATARKGEGESRETRMSETEAQQRGGNPLFSLKDNVKAFAQTVAGSRKTKTVRDLEETDTLDEATQHVGARTYVPLHTKELLQATYGNRMNDEPFVQKVDETLRDSNIVGGYDDIQTEAMALEQQPTRTADEERSLKDMQERLSDIESVQNIPALRASVDAAAQVPGVSDAIARYKAATENEMNGMYNELKGLDPDMPRETRGYRFGARVNLLPTNQEERMADFLDLDKPMPELKASNYRNPDVKRDKFGRRAKYTGQYSGSLEMMLLNSYGSRVNEVTKLRLYNKLVSSGNGILLDPGESKPDEINGEPSAVLKMKRPRTVNGKTTQVEERMAVPASKVETLRRILDTDMAPKQSPLLKALTAFQVFGVADATAHSKNQVSVVNAALAMDGSSFKSVLARVPVIGSILSGAEIYRVARQVSEGGSQITKEMAALAKNGMLRNPTKEEKTWRRFLPQYITNKFLHDNDAAARIIASRIYDKLTRSPSFKAIKSLAGKRAFVMQIGEYNRRMMSGFESNLRDWGLAPFIVAGRSFNRLARKFVFGDPGFQSADLPASVRARVAMLATPITAAVTAAIANMMTTGSPTGRAGTPFGAIDTGAAHDDEHGNRKMWDLLQTIGVRRGLRGLGLDALLSGKGVGEGIQQAVTTAGHPFFGPGAGFLYEAATGKRIDLRQGWQTTTTARSYEDKGKQYIENLRSALEHLNTAGYRAISPGIEAGLNAIGMKAPADKGYGSELGGAIAKGPLSALGYRETRTPALDLAREIQRANLPNTPPNEQQAEMYLERRGAMEKACAGDTSELRKMVREKLIRPADFHNYVRRARMTPIVAAVQHMSAEQVQRVFDKGDAEEQRLLRPILRAKMLRKRMRK